MYLRQLVPVYLYPEDTAYGIQGQVTPQMVRKQLEQTPDIRAVVITSPTYDGVVSDIKNIADTVHAYGICLLYTSWVIVTALFLRWICSRFRFRLGI